MKKLASIFLLLICITISGCGNKDNTVNTDTHSISEESDNSEAIDESKPEIKVLYDYVDYINKGLYMEASALKDEHISTGDSIDNYAPLRNIKHMKIITLKEKTGQGDIWDHIDYPTNIKDLYSYKTYYAEIEYELSHVFESFLYDGIYYHKIAFIKVTENSPWLLAEMSTADPENE